MENLCNSPHPCVRSVRNLTLLMITGLEREVKLQLMTVVGEKLNPLQFACHAKRGMDDATVPARLLFVDYSSSFHT